MPDAVVHYERGRVAAGQLHTYWGLGITTSEAIYSTDCTAILLREAPSKLPVHINEKGMITVLYPGSEGCGLLEGDTVLSVDGLPFGDTWLTSEHHVARLRSRPGASVRIIAVRPGTGRVEGTVRCQENPRSYLRKPSAFDTSRYTVRTIEKNGRPVWNAKPKVDDRSY
jgi:hypothetical protein